MQIKVKQRDITDCGAACLTSVAAWYKLKVPVARVRQFASTDKKGTNILGLIEASGKMGLLAKGVRGEWDSLFKIPKPAIAHVIINKILHHYVVVYNTTNNYIEIMDPADGEIHKVTHQEFKEQWTGVLVIITPGEKFKKGNDKVSINSRFIQLIKPSRNILIQSLVGALVFSVLGLAMSVYMGKLVDNVIPGGNLNLLNLLGISMVLIIIVRLLLSIFQTVFILKTGQKIDATLILGYYQHLLKLPQSFFDNMRTGEIISRISDAVKIRVFINEVSISLILNVFILVVSFILMFTFYSKLALMLLIVIPLYSLIYIVSNYLNKKVQRKVMEQAADLEAHLVESLNAIGTIKKFVTEDYANLKTEMKFVGLLEILYKSGINGIMSSNASGLVTQFITLFILWIGSGYVIKNEITTGELLTFYSVVGYFTGPVTGIIGFNKVLQDARISADRLFEIFDLETDEGTSRISLNPELVKDIQFENVSFRYGTRTDVFNSLNITFRRGIVTAVVGESGSGKSTLVALLQNLYPLTGGRIIIGGYDLKHFTNQSIRKCIIVVPQHIDIFAGDLIENIALGELQPDMDKIMGICKMLGMMSFIEELPAGFNTWLGENGANLSGGQKQRIAIARALYKDPEVLILDEATSSLDSISEGYVKNAVKYLRDKSKTVVIIAHRLSTINLADHVVVLDKGKIVQEGSFNELIQIAGPLKDMWKQQTIQIQQMVES